MRKNSKKDLKDLTMRNFIAVVSWEQLENVMKKKDLNKFRKWMSGQTVSEYGVYPWDLERFLMTGHENAPIFD